MSSHLTIELRPFLSIILCLNLGACKLMSNKTQQNEDILKGTIAYPFGSTKAVGIDMNRDKLVLRSLSGNHEYVVELPDDHEDFNLEVPLSEINQAVNGGRLSRRKIRDPSRTDREIVANFPSIAKTNKTETELLDNAFGVTKSRVPSDAPSYTLGIARINNLYKNRDYEYALIEIDHLRAFFQRVPSS